MTREYPFDEFPEKGSDWRAACELYDVYRAALESIAKNTCCELCREAALVAKRALCVHCKGAGYTVGSDKHGGPIQEQCSHCF